MICKYVDKKNEVKIRLNVFYNFNQESQNKTI